MTTADKWLYQGDVSLEYGGSYIDLSTWKDGYCSAVRIIDLDSGCGFTGAVMIEHVVILGIHDKKRIHDAMRCCDIDFTSWNTRDKESVRLAIAESLLSYGCYDPDDAWDNYQSHHTEILQLEADGPMQFDGWKADKRLHNTDLREYVESVHLD